LIKRFSTSCPPVANNYVAADKLLRTRLYTADITQCLRVFERPLKKNCGINQYT